MNKYLFTQCPCAHFENKYIEETKLEKDKSIIIQNRIMSLKRMKDQDFVLLYSLLLKLAGESITILFSSAAPHCLMELMCIWAL